MTIRDTPSLGTLSRAITIKDFRPSLARSLAYVAHDVFLIIALGVAVYHLDNLVTGPWNSLLWVSYWFLQGTLFWGIFVLGHDCGHESFSTSPFWNEFFGNILHSFILVPFWSWRVSHRHHHQHTGDIDNDEPFQPERISPEAWKAKHRTIGLWAQRAQILMLGGLWWPYLLFYSKQFKTHFWPLDAKLKAEAKHVYTSVICVFVMLALIGVAVHFFGWHLILRFYGVPLFVYASWLIITTFLHHNDPQVTWLGSKKWNYVAGNLGTIDRTYGVFDHFTHHIGTHQVHHLFPYIPHYFLKPATERFKGKYPEFHLFSNDSIPVAFAKNSYNYIRFGYVDPEATEFSYGTEIPKRRATGKVSQINA